jgi:hypothetical protein
MLGINDDEQGRMAARGLNTIATFAFATSYQPNQTNDSSLMELIKILTDSDDVASIPPDRVPLFRRLHFECYTMMASDMRRQVEATGDTKPQKLAIHERLARKNEQKQRLVGLRLEGELDPSHALVDAAFEIYDTDTLKYIEWSQCTKRQQEVEGVKAEDAWKVCPEAGVLKITKQEGEGHKASLNTDLRLRYALQRRGLALDQARLISFELHDQWIDHLLEQRLATPPPKYSQVSWEQLMQADRELFRRVGEECAASVRPRADGTKPLEESFIKFRDHPRVTFLLLPLPKATATEDKPSSSSSSSSLPPPTEGSSQQMSYRDDKIRNPKRQNKGRGRGGGRGKSKTLRLPKELEGMKTETRNGNPYCWAYNLPVGCKDAPPGGKCRKGVHACMHPNCSKHHSLQEHTAS